MLGFHAPPCAWFFWSSPWAHRPHGPSWPPISSLHLLGTVGPRIFCWAGMMLALVLDQLPSYYRVVISWKSLAWSNLSSRRMGRIELVCDLQGLVRERKRHGMGDVKDVRLEGKGKHVMRLVVHQSKLMSHMSHTTNYSMSTEYIFSPFIPPQYANSGWEKFHEHWKRNMTNQKCISHWTCLSEDLQREDPTPAS